MKTLRKTKDYQLNKGDGAADGLFNVTSRDESFISYLFDNETKKELIQMSAKDFNEKSKEITK
jgi:hypothetical protein